MFHDYHFEKYSKKDGGGVRHLKIHLSYVEKHKNKVLFSKIADCREVRIPLKNQLVYMYLYFYYLPISHFVSLWQLLGEDNKSHKENIIETKRHSDLKNTNNRNSV